MFFAIRSRLFPLVVRIKISNLCSNNYRTLMTSLLSVNECSKPQIYQFVYQTVYRYKSKIKKLDTRKESESEDEEKVERTLDDEIIDKNTKVLNSKVTSLRADVLLKVGLGMARNKIDTLFYESKVRVNGEKLIKKSENLKEGDEVDVVKGVSDTNPKFLVVARVEVLSVTVKGEAFAVRLRRSKSLIIENYSDPWKA